MSTQPDKVDDTPAHLAPVDDVHPFHDAYLIAFIEAHKADA